MAPQYQSRDPATHPGAALGAELKALRRAKGFDSQEAIAREFGADRSVATKAETGEVPPIAPVLDAWLDACDVHGGHRSALMALWRMARIKEDPYRQRTAPWYETEAEAHTLRYWAPLLFPGPTQTEDYARELFSIWGYEKTRIGELVAERIDRRKILVRPEQPDVTIIVWQRLLDTVIGTPEIMRDQLALLLELSEQPNIHVQVLPADGVNKGLGGAIHLATTNTDEVLLAEGFTEDRVVAEPEQVRHASTTFSSIRADALRRSESQAVMTEAMERWSK